MTSAIVTAIAFAAFVYRCATRRIRFEEAFLFAVFAMHYVFIQGTILLVYGAWGDIGINGAPCWRYHYPSVPLILGLAVLPIVAIGLRLKLKRSFFVFLLGVLLLLNVVQGIRTAQCKNNYGRDWQTIQWAAAKIKSDWKGVRLDDARPTRENYMRIGRPAVLTVMPAVPYYAGGREALTDNAQQALMDADYALDPDWLPYFLKRPANGSKAWEMAWPLQFEEMSRFHDGKHQHVLYRRKK